MILAERARLRGLALAIPHDRAQAASFITLSVGIAEKHPGEAVADTIKRADLALYKAKHAGRNRVVAASELEAKPYWRSQTLAALFGIPKPEADYKSLIWRG
jgi:predicted signal transduction protein with EAL and GGDEF domain